MARSHAETRRRAGDPFVAFLGYLVDIEAALSNRNWAQLGALLRKRKASHIPREVREELVMMSRAPRASFRAPIRFLQFQYRMTQLAMSGDTLPTAQTELGFDSDQEPRRVRRADRARRAAARDGRVTDGGEADRR